VLRWILLAGFAAVVLQVSGVLGDSPSYFGLMLLPLSAAVAYSLLSGS
jgi:hypothetical protein